MSTRCRIGIKNPDGTITSVYCHFDGYPDGVGKTLITHYTEETKVKELISFGDMSSLEKEVSTTLPHSYNRPQKDVTVFYGRDRGETNIESRTCPSEAYCSLACKSSGNYAYVFENNKWICFEVYDFKKIDLYSQN